MPTPNDMPQNRHDQPPQQVNEAESPADERVYGPELPPALIAERAAQAEQVPTPYPPRGLDETAASAPPPPESDVQYTGAEEGDDRDPAGMDSLLSGVMEEIHDRKKARKLSEARENARRLLDPTTRPKRVTKEELDEARKNIREALEPEEDSEGLEE